MREHDDADGSEGGWTERLGGDFVVRLLSGLAMGVGVALFTLSGSTPFALMVVAISLVAMSGLIRSVPLPAAQQVASV